MEAYEEGKSEDELFAVNLSLRKPNDLMSPYKIGRASCRERVSRLV